MECQRADRQVEHEGAFVVLPVRAVGYGEVHGLPVGSSSGVLVCEGLVLRVRVDPHAAFSCAVSLGQRLGAAPEDDRDRCRGWLLQGECLERAGQALRVPFEVQPQGLGARLAVMLKSHREGETPVQVVPARSRIDDRLAACVRLRRCGLPGGKALMPPRQDRPPTRCGTCGEGPFTWRHAHFMSPCGHRGQGRLRRISALRRNPVTAR